tara:strand:- start:75 stop:404 length:330 start_codon:yes stop_codon:yes gene_type:complete
VIGAEFLRLSGGMERIAEGHDSGQTLSSCEMACHSAAQRLSSHQDPSTLKLLKPGLILLNESRKFGGRAWLPRFQGCLHIGKIEAMDLKTPAFQYLSELIHPGRVGRLT